MKNIYFPALISLLLGTASADVSASSLQEEKGDSESDSPKPRKRSNSKKKSAVVISASDAVGDPEIKTSIDKPPYEVLAARAKELSDQENDLNLQLQQLKDSKKDAVKKIKTLEDQKAGFLEINLDQHVQEWATKIATAKKHKKSIQAEIDTMEEKLQKHSYLLADAIKSAEDSLTSEWKEQPFLPVQFKETPSGLTFSHILTMMGQIIPRGKKDWDDSVFEFEDEETAYRFSLVFDDFKRDRYFDKDNIPTTFATYCKVARTLQPTYKVQFEKSLETKEGYLEGEKLIGYHYTIQDETANHEIVDRFFISMATKPAEQRKKEKARGNELFHVESGSAAQRKALKTVCNSYNTPDAWTKIFETFYKAKRVDKVEADAPVLTYHHLWHLVAEAPVIRKGSKPSFVITTETYVLTFKLKGMNQFDDLKPSDYIHFDHHTWSPPKMTSGSLGSPQLTMHFDIYNNSRARRKAQKKDFLLHADKGIDISIELRQEKKKDDHRDGDLEVEKIQKLMRGEETPSLRSRRLAMMRMPSTNNLGWAVYSPASPASPRSTSPNTTSPSLDSSPEDALIQGVSLLTLKSDEQHSSSSSSSTPETTPKTSRLRSGAKKTHVLQTTIEEESAEDSSSPE